MNTLHPALKHLRMPHSDYGPDGPPNDIGVEINDAYVDGYNAALIAVTPILYKLQEEARKEGRDEQEKLDQNAKDWAVHEATSKLQ